jgi:beta-barrel assembly-enhancing protease
MLLCKFLLLYLALLCACSQNPVTGKSEFSLLSESQEIGMGEANYSMMQQAEGGAYVTYQEIEKYVDEVGQRLAAVSDRPQLPYEFIVLNNSIPNAWALPGGKIAVNRGLLVELDNEAELAAVLAHEIVHSAARHGAQAMERSLLMGMGMLGLSQILKDHKYENVAIGSAVVGAGLLSLKYSREAELEADRYGINYMVAAGYDPEAAVTLQEKFVRLAQERSSDWFEGLFATHPPSEERLQENRKLAALYPLGGRLGTQDYQQKIAPLITSKKAYEALDRGYIALAKGNPSRALDLSLEGITIEPREAHLYNLKGKAELLLHDHTTALTSFSQAIERNPNYFDFYLQKGLLEKKLGDDILAREDLDRSVHLFPSAEAHYALGEIALKRGDRYIALEHFRVAAQADSLTGRLARQKLVQFRGFTN